MADSRPDVQAIVAAYADILAAADGNDTNNGAAALSAGDYSAIGVTGLDAAAAALLSDVIDGKAVADVGSVADIQSLASAVQAVLGYTGSGSAPTADQINALIAGQTPTDETDALGANVVSNAALPTALAALAAAQPIANQQELADIIFASAPAYDAAFLKIETYANPTGTSAARLMALSSQGSSASLVSTISRSLTPTFSATLIRTRRKPAGVASRGRRVGSGHGRAAVPQSAAAGKTRAPVPASASKPSPHCPSLPSPPWPLGC
jgi:hypothetical protein